MLHPQKSVVGRSGVQHSRSIARGLQKTLSTVAEVPADASVTGYIQVRARTALYLVPPHSAVLSPAPWATGQSEGSAGEWQRFM